MPITDVHEAVRMLYKTDSGSIERIDGTVLSGPFIDHQDELNDPMEIGFITLRGKDGRLDDVYHDEFAALLESPVGTPV